MKKLTTLLFLSFLAAIANAQEVTLHGLGMHESDVELRVSQQGSGANDMEYILAGYKRKPGKYSVCVEFDMPGSGIFKVMRGNMEELLRSKYGIPRFSFSYFVGEVNGRVKKDFVYRLPFEEGRLRSLKILRYEGSQRNKKDKVDRVSYVFDASEGDDVYAMRKGTVARIEDTGWFLDGFLNDQVLRKANKLVCVEHSDGTTAYYVGIMDGTLNVEEGTTVYPDTKLGKAGTLDNENYEIRVSVDYYTAPLMGQLPDFRNVKGNPLDACFLTKEGTVRLEDGREYGAATTSDLIYKEMNKREKRNRNKK